jgi:hypothetical protein
MGGGASKQLPDDTNTDAFDNVDTRDSTANLIPVEFHDRALGLELAPRKKGGVVIKHVVPGFSAAKHGSIRRGMRVMTVDGEDVATLPLQDCLTILHRAPRPVTVVFKDGIFYRRAKHDDEDEEATPKNVTGANDDDAVYATNETFADEYDGPVCFFCESPATSRIQVGGEYQCVCDACGEWRRRARAQAGDSLDGSIRKHRLDSIPAEVRKRGAVDFFVSGGYMNHVPVEDAPPRASVSDGQASVVGGDIALARAAHARTSSSLDSFLEGLPMTTSEPVEGTQGSTPERALLQPSTPGDLDEATAALLRQIQEEDAREAAEHQRRQQEMDQATADAIAQLQEQDRVEDAIMRRQQEMQREAVQAKVNVDKATADTIAQLQEQDRAEDAARRRRQEMQRETAQAEAGQLLLLQQQQEQAARQREEALLRQHYETRQREIQNRDEQMVLAAIQMSQLQNQLLEQQSAEIPEPFSWKVPKGVGYTLAELENEGGGGGDNTASQAVPRLGERHCRQRGCGCTQFREEPTRPTICTCRHGEMYHRLDEEAPLARTNVPGVYKCEYCHVNIVKENGFSGWYNEVRGGDGAVVHVECWEEYKDSVSARCFHCQQPLRKKEGVFNGRYCKVNGHGKCHKECLEPHKVSVGEVCELCEEALLRPYIILRDGSGGLRARSGRENLTIHKDCWHAFLRGGGDEKKPPNWKKRILT